MKIGFVSSSPDVFGAEELQLRLAPLLAERGVEPVLCAPDPASSPFGRRWRELGFQAVENSAPSSAGIRRSDGSRPSPAELASEIVRTSQAARALVPFARSVDLVHSHSLHGHLDALAASRLARKPFVMHVHDIVVPGMGRRLLGIGARGATATVAISSAVAETLRGAPRVKVIPNGIDPDRFPRSERTTDLHSELGINPQHHIILLVCRIHPLKDIDLAIKAWPSVHQDAHLVHVGGVHPGYEALAGELEAAAGDRVHFLGQRSDIASVMASSTAVLSTARAEPFGLTLLEAQCVGRPVLCSSGGGAVEFVKNNETGKHFEAGSSVDLARVLNELLDDLPMRSRLVEQAYEQAIAEYSLTSQADRLVALYQCLLGPSDS